MHQRSNAQALFLKDVGAHSMDVLRDDGVGYGVVGDAR